MICEWNLLLWGLELAYFREKNFKFWWPCRSREINGDPATRPVKQINKIIQSRTQNIKTVLHKQIIATPRLTHSRSNKCYIAIFASFLISFPSTSLVQITVVSLANLHKRPEALTRHYVTSYWQAEWLKKLRWKTIELPSPAPPVEIENFALRDARPSWIYDIYGRPYW